MKDLVEDMLTLARTESGTRLPEETVDLSDTVLESALAFEPVAFESGRELSYDIQPELTVRGSAVQLRRLADILLDNAMKYALDSAPVRIGLKKEKAGVVLRCLNACAELPQEELNKLFDRFYRPDKSRSSETGGFGIGLSIARSIAQAHKGTIKAAAPQPGIIEFTAVLK